MARPTANAMCLTRMRMPCAQSAPEDSGIQQQPLIHVVGLSAQTPHELHYSHQQTGAIHLCCQAKGRVQSVVKW